jgi:DNA-binding transcriptional LysR family regulator
MHLDDLQVFLAVAERQGFSRAATQLDMPKASVSRAVARLEQAMGMRLLERSTRRLRLTDSGRRLAEQTAPLASRLASLLAQAAEHDDRPRGVLRIAAPYELGVFRIGDVLTELLLAHPALEAEVELTSQPIDPRDRDYDVVFRLQTTPLPDSNQVARRIYSVARGLYASPALIARMAAPHSPEDLAGWPAILSPEDGEWTLTGPDGEQYTLQPAGRLRAQNVGMRLHGVSAGLGMGLLSTHFCRQSLLCGDIVPVLPDYRIAPTRVFALLPGRRLMPAKVKAFLDLLSEAMIPWDEEGGAGLARWADSVEE